MSVPARSDTELRRPTLLLGATDYAAVFLDSFEDVPGLRITGFVQNLDPLESHREILGRPVLWSGSITAMRETHDLIAILATTKRSDWIAQMIERDFRFTTLVHPASTASKRSEVGVGVSIDAGTVVAAFSIIGDHVRIGRCVSIGHHTGIGRYSTIHPGAIISGHCQVGEKVTVGTGAVIVDRIEIGDGAFIAAGAVVTKRVPPRALVAGNPSRIICENYGPK